MSDDAALRAIRRVLLGDLGLRRWVFWCDLMASAAIAWVSTIAMVAWPVTSWIAGPVAIVATLRAAYFVHEIAHSRRQLPTFEIAWNFVIGIWVLLPSFMADAHIDHHRISTYGGADDPEYAPIASWSRAHLVGSVLAMGCVPPLLVLRFAIIGPLSWWVPALRRITWQRLSTLQTNPNYVRPAEGSREPRVIALELAAGNAIVAVVLGIAFGWIPLHAVFIWSGVTAGALMLNQVRTLVAHGYVPLARSRTLAEQVADSRTANSGTILTNLVYPVGTRFHALHHFAPTLPYHALGEADRRLRASPWAFTLAAGDHAGLLDGLGPLWNRAHRA